jgi:peptidoglycan/LPS O-acetylase OafA/YrhL
LRKPERRHFAALDGLRGVAAIVVLAVHALDPFELAYLVPHARLAVDFFFLLSGFVICFAYEQQLLTNMTIGDFVRVRLIRLYPLYIFGLICGFVVFLARFYFKQNGFDIYSIVAVVLNYFLIPTSLVHNEGWNTAFPFNAPSWSLFFELFINLIYLFIVPRLSTRLLLTILLISGLVVVTQAYIMGGVIGGENWDNLVCGLGRVFFPFFCGVLLFRWYRARADFNFSLPGSVLAMILVATFAWPVIGLNWVFESAIVLTIFPMLVIGGAQNKPGPKTSAVYVFLGRLSYPLYILHYPVIRMFSFLARALSLEDRQIWMLVVIEIICVVLFTIVVMKAFDEPLRKWLSARMRTRRFSTQIPIDATLMKAEPARLTARSG